MPFNYESSLEHGKYGRRFRGSFAPAGAAISTAAGAVRGTGFTPSWVATGVYRITLDEPFVRLLSANLTYQGNTADTSPTYLVIGDVNVSNRTVDIVVFVDAGQPAAKADIAASGVLRRINFELIVAVEDIPGAGASA